jgi:nitrogen fixation NifU-like protein
VGGINNMYTEKIIEHFKNPKHAGEIKNPDAIGQEGNPQCGDIMKIFLKIKDNRITDVKFKTFGCIAAIATSDMLCELAKGKIIEEALALTPKDIINSLGDMPPIKHHCSLLGIKALKNAITDYKTK